MMNIMFRLTQVMTISIHDCPYHDDPSHDHASLGNPCNIHLCHIFFKCYPEPYHPDKAISCHLGLYDHTGKNYLFRGNHGDYRLHAFVIFEAT